MSILLENQIEQRLTAKSVADASPDKKKKKKKQQKAQKQNNEQNDNPV